MLRLVESAQLHPVIDETFPLDQTRSALERMDAGKHVGKIIVSVA